ncbi:hypothetical protein MCEL_25460 [Mycolicibacterium celeriflavum]|uniref:Uncharacterized protein n=1 Tax=Mycolicibacterium celeriflavum TaxID=1249101 RepID=A0A7I7RJH5_MYCCF|nr:hypothetical protein MCEL_25460 [Mycolicibacterium celeriflavum]
MPIDDTRAAGSAVMAVNTRSNRSSNVVMVSGSKTSLRNSTDPEIPAGSAVSVHCSDSEKDRSMRAVWVCTGT